MSDYEQNKDTEEIVSSKQEKDLVSEEIMVTLVAPSLKKTYDGRPLEGNAKGPYRVRAIGLPEDYTVEANVTGSQTNAGTGVNLVSEDFVIRDADGVDRTEDFPNVTLMSGTLTVIPRPLTIITSSASKAFDGTALADPRVEARGLVRGETLTVEATGSIEEVGRVLNGCAITWSGANPANYIVTKRLGTLEITPSSREIVLTAASCQKTYDGQPLECPGVSVTGLPDGFTLEASASGSQISVGRGESRVEDGFVILDANGKDKTARFTNVVRVPGSLTVNPCPLTLYTDSAVKPYDGTPLQEPGARMEGLVPGESVTLRVTGEMSEVGITSNTCDVIWDNASPENYHLNQLLGTLEVTKNDGKVVLTASSAAKVFDGTPLESPEVSAEGLPESLRLEARANGSQTDSGSCANSVVPRFRILNAAGEDKTENFTNVELVEGVLTVTPRSVTIITGTDTIPYDGMALTSEAAEIVGLAPNDSVTLIATGSITEIGSAPNTYEIVWDNAKQENYQVTEALGTLTVTENTDPVVLTAASLSKTYDGKPLEGGENDVMVSGLVEGFHVEAWTQGSQTDVGTSVNKVDEAYRILNEQGEDRTDNFLGVMLVDGRLTVNRRPITIRTASASKGYDGEPLTNPSASIEGLVQGESVTIRTTGSITEVGSTANTYEISWDFAREDNYRVTENLGTLTVVENRVRRRLR